MGRAHPVGSVRRIPGPDDLLLRHIGQRRSSASKLLPNNHATRTEQAK
jgi:hypothetical protein